MYRARLWKMNQNHKHNLDKTNFCEGTKGNRSGKGLQQY